MSVIPQAHRDGGGLPPPLHLSLLVLSFDIFLFFQPLLVQWEEVVLKEKVLKTDSAARLTSPPRGGRNEYLPVSVTHTLSHIPLLTGSFLLSDNEQP